MRNAAFDTARSIVELRPRLVQEAEAAVKERLVDLAGEMEERRAGGRRLDERARSVAGAGAGAGDDDAKPARDAGRRVRHVGGARLAARRHEADTAAPVDRVEDRNVVNADDAEGEAHAGALEEGGDDVAERGRRRGAHGASRKLRTASSNGPGASM